ncbi:hypothetical protein, partial [Xylella fastidiosa]|uniref:hypothetical protein n=1 Tax=Xylella fastidiosa TaxID=2371 RepID=UPI0019D675E8
GQKQAQASASRIGQVENMVSQPSRKNKAMERMITKKKNNNTFLPDCVSNPRSAEKPMGSSIMAPIIATIKRITLLSLLFLL